MDKTPIEISAIVISFNGMEFLADCLESLKEDLEGRCHEVIVVDNGSTDGSTEFVRNRYPSFILIENNSNRGFAAAVNMGMRKARGDYLYVLNQDLRFRKGTIDQLLARMKMDPTIGLIGPKYIGFDGNTQKSARGFPSYRHALYGLFRLHRLSPQSRELGHWPMTWFDHETEAFVDQPMGAVMLIPRRVVETIGYLDERFPIFFNDVDYCRRMMVAGFKRLYYPRAVVEHFVGGSTRKMRTKMLFVSRWSLYRYLNKYAKPQAQFFLSLVGLPIFLDLVYQLAVARTTH